MLDQSGFVTECTGDNIFIVKGETLVTPPVSVGILNGITRAAVLGLAAKAGLKATQGMLTRFDLFTSDEVFLTGSAAEIVPVVKMDGRIIGSGKVGVCTLKLTREFHKLTKKDGVRYAV
jgi:branched-chain amino acid aminotransferase